MSRSGSSKQKDLERKESQRSGATPSDVEGVLNPSTNELCGLVRGRPAEESQDVEVEHAVTLTLRLSHPPRIRGHGHDQPPKQDERSLRRIALEAMAEEYGKNVGRLMAAVTVLAFLYVIRFW